MIKTIIFVLLLLVLIPTTTLAWDDCPSSEVLCEGKCGLFVDTDSDGICDHSQLAPEDRNNNIIIDTETMEEEVHDLISGKDLKTKTVDEIAGIYRIDKTKYAKELPEYYGVNIKTTDSFQFLQDNYAVEPSIAKDIAVSIKTGQQVVISESGDNKSKRNYHLLSISLSLLLLYFISYILSKKKIISPVNHKKIWNILLFVTFLISGVLGILLVIKINFGIAIPLPFNILFWHVEIGIAMFVICIFHIIERQGYFKNILKF